jgi:hypothetical protein
MQGIVPLPSTPGGTKKGIQKRSGDKQQAEKIPPPVNKWKVLDDTTYQRKPHKHPEAQEKVPKTE